MCAIDAKKLCEKDKRKVELRGQEAAGCEEMGLE